MERTAPTASTSIFHQAVMRRRKAEPTVRKEPTHSMASIADTPFTEPAGYATNHYRQDTPTAMAGVS